MMAYRWFAKVYGFTPRQVDDDLTLEEYEALPKIERGEAGAAEIKQRQERAAQLHEQKKRGTGGW